MDPVTSVGLAAAVVQLVQFSAALISESVEIHKSTSGATHQNADLEALTGTFEGLRIDLDKRAAASAGATATTAQQSLQSITDECSQLSKELMDKLESIKVRDGHLKSVRAGLKSVMARSSIESMQAKLSRLESRLQQRVLVQLSTQLKELDIAKCFEEIDEGQRKLVNDLIANSTTFVAECAKQNSHLDLRFEDTRSHVTREQVKSRKHFDCTASRLGKRMREDLHATVREEGSRIRRHIDNAVSRDSFGKKLEDLKKSLYFPEMHAREHDIEIKDREARTFSWILDDTSTKQANVHFVQWLRSGDGIYWIQGKVGSGKSTLMHIIQRDYRTKDYLQTWATGSELVYASYFFWYSGVQQLQHTLEGLLRTILYRCLIDAPILDEIILGPLVERSPRPREYYWSLSELIECFRRLLVQKSVKVALFVDGLDEFSGNYVELIKLLNSTASLTNIKTCLSSRPETSFATAFGHAPGLRLQDLTEDDIAASIVHRLGEDFLPPGSSDYYPFGSSSREPSSREMIGQIMVQRANGVFVWVVAVATAIELAIYEGESDEGLLRYIEGFPEDLDRVYRRILEFVKPYRRKQMALLSQMMLTIRAQPLLSRVSVPWVPWSFPMLLDMTEDEALKATFDLSAPFPNMTGVEPWRDCSGSSDRPPEEFEANARKQLQNISSGLFEIDSWMGVEYLHKTVNDFLRLPNTQHWLLQQAPGFGDVELLQHWLTMTLLHIKWYTQNFSEAVELAHIAFMLASKATKRQEHVQKALLQELDRCVSALYAELLDNVARSGKLSKENHAAWARHHWSCLNLLARIPSADWDVLPWDDWDPKWVLEHHKPLGMETSLLNEPSNDVFLHIACCYGLYEIVSAALQIESDASVRARKAGALTRSFCHFFSEDLTLELIVTLIDVLESFGGCVPVNDDVGLDPLAHLVVRMWYAHGDYESLGDGRSLGASFLTRTRMTATKVWVSSHREHEPSMFIRLSLMDLLHGLGLCEALEEPTPQGCSDEFAFVHIKWGRGTGMSDLFPAVGVMPSVREMIDWLASITKGQEEGTYLTGLKVTVTEDSFYIVDGRGCKVYEEAMFKGRLGKFLSHLDDICEVNHWLVECESFDLKDLDDM